VTAGVQVEGAGLAHQLHRGLAGQLIAFATIACVAARDKVLPGGGTPARTGNHVIEREFSRGEHLSTVLAGIAIAQENVLPRERAGLMGNASVFE